MLVAFVFLTLANSLAFVAAQVSPMCLNNGNYTANSTYRANLDAVLSTLPPNIGRNGFYNASDGQAPDRVNAMALCRGDIELDPCRDCVRTAIAELGRSCPYQKQAIIWNGNECMVRYSDVEIVRTLAISPELLISNGNNVSSPDQFEGDLNLLLEGLRTKAVNGGFERKVAGGNTSGPDSQTIYALVQCTPDLFTKDCDDCLIGAAQQLPSCCNDKRGGRVMRPSCFLRFEDYSFLNQITLQRLEGPAPEPPAIPMPQPPVSSPTGNGGSKKRRIIIIAASIMVGALAVVIIVGLLLRNRREPEPVKQAETTDEVSSAKSLQFAFSTISAATNDFSDGNKLGQGGFGAVYKGILPNGQEIAAKRLSKDSRQGSLEFKNEVLLLARLQHKNLVRLLGFCLEGMEKLLVYEFIPNGSLDHLLFDPINQSYLKWDRRHKIISGIAKAILYLHEDSRLKIIHRDLKASNILLDSQMNPKVADFGTAKLFGQDETQGSTGRIVGTYGYMPPEYVTHGHFSVKSDVFSFGVLVLEIISGQKNSRRIQWGESALDLLSFAWKRWCNGTSADIVDPVLRSRSSSMTDILRCIHIGLLCVQKNAADRPTMAAVILMLSSCTVTLAVPSEPAFYVGSGSDSSSFSSQQDKDSLSGRTPAAQLEEDASKNDASISEMYPR